MYLSTTWPVAMLLLTKLYSQYPQGLQYIRLCMYSAISLAEDDSQAVS